MVILRVNLGLELFLMKQPLVFLEELVLKNYNLCIILLLLIRI